MTKPCSKCKEIKPLTEFNKNKNLRLGVQSQCRKCCNEWKPTPEALKIAREKTRHWNRLKLTGFTQEEFVQKLNSQGNVCAICGTDNPGKLDFCADHNHKTGQKRGVLCRKCNTGLGHFNDDLDIISKAIEYLVHYTK